MLDLFRRYVGIGRHGDPKLGQFGQALARLGFRLFEIQLRESAPAGAPPAGETDQPVRESAEESGSTSVIEAACGRSPVEPKGGERGLQRDRKVPELPAPPTP